MLKSRMVRRIACLGTTLAVAVVAIGCSTPVTHDPPPPVADPTPQWAETAGTATESLWDLSYPPPSVEPKASSEVPVRANISTPLPMPTSRYGRVDLMADESELGAWDPAWEAADVAIDLSGDFAYVVGGHDGFSVVDLRDPANPREIGSFPSDEGESYPASIAQRRRTFRLVVADAGRAFVSAENSIFWLELADPRQPRIVDSVGVGGTYGYMAPIWLGHGQLFAENLVGGPAALPVDDSDGFGDAIPLEIPAIWPWLDAAANATHLFVARGSLGIEVVDVDDSRPFRSVRRFEPEWDAERIALSGDRAFVVGGRGSVDGGGLVIDSSDRALHVLDISDPSRPVEVARREPSLEIGEERYDVDVETAGEIVALLSSDGLDHHLEVLDARNVSALSPLGTVRLTGRGAPGEPRVSMAAGLAVVALGRQGLRVVDISEPTAPRLIGSIDTVQGVRDVVIKGNVAYAVSWHHGLRIVDVSDPKAPSELGFFDPPEQVEAVAVRDGTAYVGAGGLHVLDVGDPRRPQLIARCVDSERFEDKASEHVLSIWLEDEQAYLSTSSYELIVLDISDRVAPKELSRFEGAGFGGRLVVRDGVAFVAATWNGVRIIDVGDPARPRSLSEYRAPEWLPPAGPVFDAFKGAADLWLDEDRLYVAAGDDGLHVLDVSDPRHPRLLRHVDVLPVHNRHQPRIETVMAEQGLLFVGSGFGIVQALDPATLLADGLGTKVRAMPVRTIFTEGTVQRLVAVGDRLYAAANFAGLRIIDLAAVMEPDEVR